MSRRSITDEAGASPSHPSTVGLMGATLTAPIAGSSQMLGTIGALVNPDVHADTEHDLALEAGIEVRPTQPPHPSLIVDVPSGYLEDLGTYGTPDTVNIEDILSIDVTPLASGAHAISCPDMSFAAFMSVEFEDMVRKIQEEDAATSEFIDDTVGARRSQFRILHIKD